MTEQKSLFENSPDLVPVPIDRNMSISRFVETIGKTAFEARNMYRGAALFKRMITEGDLIWLGFAGAGIAGGMGGILISLLKAGFIDVICVTGAQVYHDLHFAFDLPVKAISPNWNDNHLRKHGDTRIYDIGIREKETLEAQDRIIRNFIKETHHILTKKHLGSWEFNYYLGKWVNETAIYPERSFVAAASELGVPVFWDSLSNHSIAMNMVRTDAEGYPITLSAQKDIFDSAAINYASGSTGFLLMGGGGPKNFIQQTGPTINQILEVDYKGAERGIQIGTAMEREGSLSGCTFSEAVTWGKYQATSENRLVQIWGEYSILFPLLAAYALDQCKDRSPKKVISNIYEFTENLYQIK
jgi:deoxyhypusine synthase